MWNAGPSRPGQQDRLEPSVQAEGLDLRLLALSRAVADDREADALTGQRVDDLVHARSETDLRPVVAIDGHEIGRRVAVGDVRERRSQPVEAVAPDAPLEAVPQPRGDGAGLGGIAARRSPDGLEPAPDVVAFVVQRVVKVEDDAADHHRGSRVNRSAFARVMYRPVS